MQLPSPVASCRLPVASCQLVRHWLCNWKICSQSVVLPAWPPPTPAPCCHSKCCFWYVLSCYLVTLYGCTSFAFVASGTNQSIEFLYPFFFSSSALLLSAERAGVAGVGRGVAEQYKCTNQMSVQEVLLISRCFFFFLYFSCNISHLEWNSELSAGQLGGCALKRKLSQLIVVLITSTTETTLEEQRQQQQNSNKCNRNYYKPTKNCITHFGIARKQQKFSYAPWRLTKKRRRKYFLSSLTVRQWYRVYTGIL